MNGITCTQSGTQPSWIRPIHLIKCWVILSMGLMLLLFPNYSMAQKKSKNLKQALREATILFDEGYPKKVPPLLNSALKIDAETDVKIRAYELLTTTYLFLKEEEKADTAYLKLLSINPAYKPKEESVTPDLLYFSESFITYPRLSLGLKIGNNFTNAVVLNSYSVDNTLHLITENDSEGEGEGEGGEKYLRKGGLNVGFHINYALTKNVLSLIFEPTFSNRNYGYSETLQSRIPHTDNWITHAVVDLTEKQTWIDLPLLLRTSVGSPELKFYVEAGGAANLMLNAKFSTINTGPARENDFDLLENNLRKKFNFSIVAGAGIEYRVKLNYLSFGVQYQSMFRNIKNTTGRFDNPLLIYKFGLIENDFTFNNLMINFGFIKPFYASQKRKQNVHF